MLDRFRMLHSCISWARVSPVRTARILFLVCLVTVVGCGALGSGFVALIDPDGTSGLASLDNAPGHVVVTFVNNTVFDERLLNYLESPEGGGLFLAGSQGQPARPLIRLSVGIRFVGSNQDDATVTVEFGSGNGTVEADFAAEDPAASFRGLSNMVFLCDVASVELIPNTDIEVLIPVELTEYELIETISVGGVVLGVVPVVQGQTAPAFRTIAVDEVGEDGVVLRRNIDQRDVPSPVINPRCGSVIAITVEGVLSVPFLAGIDDTPSFDGADEQTVAGIGGRYRFRVSVQ